MKIYTLFIGIILLVTSCQEKSTKNEPLTSENIPFTNNLISLNQAELTAAQLKTQPLQMGIINTDLHVNGKMDVPPTAIASVSIPMGGYIQDIVLIPGNYVQKGSVLATVKDPLYIQLQEDYLTAKAKAQFLSQDLERQQLLMQQDAVSKKVYQQALSDFSTNAIQLKALAEKLKLIHIDPLTLSIDKMVSLVKVIAPISGYISKVNINRGKYVAPTDVLLEIIDPNDMHAAITVFEKDIAAFHVGMKGKVELSNAISPESYPVTVIAVSKGLDEEKTGLVHCHFKSIPKQVLPGMFLTAHFSTVAKDALVVPINALQRFQGTDYIFIQNNTHQFEAKKVQIGTSNKTSAALINPDAREWLGKKIVVENGYSLLGKLMNKAE